MLSCKYPLFLSAAALAAGLLNSTADAAALTENEAKGFKLTKAICSDTFEEASQREGAPEIFRAPISNGLLEYTSQARYSAKGLSEFGFKQRRFRTPGNERGFFAYGFRLYSLEGGAAEILCTSATSSFSVRLERMSDTALLCQVYDAKRKPGNFELPFSSLPADVMLYSRKDGGFAVLATSLADGSVRKAFGDSGFFREEFADGFDVRVRLESEKPEAPAVLVMDNLTAGEAVSTGKSAVLSPLVKPEEAFDPVKAGWKKVFEDDFNGTEIDWSKWYQNPWGKNKDHVSLDGEGHLALKCDFKPGTTNLVSTSILSRPVFTYGYAEAKVKFTKNNGWWAAFWLYGTSNTNPGVDGSEIDIFEDYYTRAATPAGPHHPILDHNLHVSVGKTLQSWQYRSHLPGTLDDWYVIGCKWTPFEISYYVNGKLMKSTANHSPYSTVTFDAKNHAALNCPLHIIFSGCIMRGWGRRDTTGFKFPEYFKIDHVRYWEYPKDDPALPKVAWKTAADGERVVVPAGEKISFEAEVTESAATKAPIKEVLLFDCGHPVAVCKQAPWKLEIPFTEEYYRTTRYMSAGRSGKTPPWDAIAHAFRLYVVDAEGRVSSTDDIRWRIPAPQETSTAWKGKAHAVPGKIAPWQFDEGGRGVAYYSHSATIRTKGAGRYPLLRKDSAFDCRPKSVYQLKTGEWMNYTVNVEEGGKFKATLDFGTGNYFPNKVLVVVDGVKRGEFDCPWPGKWDWALRTSQLAGELELSAGRHVITLVQVGYLSMGALTLERVNGISEK